MPTVFSRDDEIVPGYTLIRRLASGMAGEVWIARASGGVRVAIKFIKNLGLLGSQRELGALRIIREVKHPNLCPFFGIWFFDRDGNLFDLTDTDLLLFNDSDDTATIWTDEVQTVNNQNRDSTDQNAWAETRPMDSDFVKPMGANKASAKRKKLQPAQMVLAMGSRPMNCFPTWLRRLLRSIKWNQMVPPTNGTAGWYQKLTFTRRFPVELDRRLVGRLIVEGLLVGGCSLARYPSQANT